MDIFQVIILGIVQGITEWLPISSSGHLVLFETILNVKQPVIFDIVLHLGSLVVVFAVFWKQIIELIIGVFQGKKEKLMYLLYLMIATIPIALVGYFLNDIIKSIFTELYTVGYGLLFTAIVLYLSQYPKKKAKQLTASRALLTGIGQAFAILPGVSRSGTTISTGLMQGIKREDTAVFAFLLFIPAIMGATLLEIGSLNQITNLSALLVGVVTTMIVGFFTLKILLNIIKKGKLHYFSIYCLVIGLIVLGFAYF